MDPTIEGTILASPETPHIFVEHPVLVASLASSARTQLA